MFTIKYIRICLSVSAFLCMSSRTRVWFQLLIKAHLVCARELKTQIDTSLSLSFSFSFFSSLSLSLLHTSLGTTIYLSFNITLYEHYLYTNPLSPTLSPLQLYSHFLTLIHAFSLSLSLSLSSTYRNTQQQQKAIMCWTSCLLAHRRAVSFTGYLRSLSLCLSLSRMEVGSGWSEGNGWGQNIFGKNWVGKKLSLSRDILKERSSRKHIFEKKKNIVAEKIEPTNQPIDRNNSWRNFHIKDISRLRYFFQHDQQLVSTFHCLVNETQ